MKNLRVARAVYALMLAFGYFNWMRIYPKLPQRIAVHFGYDGTPNGWAPKDGLLWTTLIVPVILSVTTMGIPRLVTAVSDDHMNLPHRAYWLAPERRKQTMGFIEAQSVWFGCAVLLLLYTALQLAMDANLSPDKHFDSDTMWAALGVFFYMLMRRATYAEKRQGPRVLRSFFTANAKPKSLRGRNCPKIFVRRMSRLKKSHAMRLSILAPQKCGKLIV